MVYLNEKEIASINSGIALIKELKYAEKMLNMDLKDLIQFHENEIRITLETAKSKSGKW